MKQIHLFVFLSQYLFGVICVFMPSVKLKVECKVTAIQDNDLQ